MRLQRLDEFLLVNGVGASKRDAFVLVTEGRIFVNGQKAVSPAQLVSKDDDIEVRPAREFVGRGAYKLEAAIEKFNIDVRAKVCADIGAATGGFTDAFLKHGAAKVYAIDVGRGKLDLKLREDPRVVVMEETNVLTMPAPAEPVDFVAIDVSFISLKKVLPKIGLWLVKGSSADNSSDRLNSPRGLVVALFKPQYEIEDKSLLKHGILRDEEIRLKLLEKFRAWLGENNWQELGFMESPIRGSAGNVECLFYLRPATPIEAPLKEALY